MRIVTCPYARTENLPPALPPHVAGELERRERGEAPLGRQPGPRERRRRRPDPRRSPRAAPAAPAAARPARRAGARRTPTPIQEIEHVLRRAHDVRAFAPAGRSARTRAARSPVPERLRPGDPDSCANPAVSSAPERSPASTTTVIADRAAMIRLRAGNVHLRTCAPGGQLGHGRAGGSDPRMERSLRRRIRALGPAGQDGDRGGGDPERPRVRGRVDPERHPADHRNSGRTEPAAERIRDLDPVHRRPARADDRHRLVGDQAQESVKTAGDVQDRGRALKRSQSERIARARSGRSARSRRPPPGARASAGSKP